MSLALSDTAPLEPGTRLDRYELLCPIAHGGMASVWIARLTGKHGFEKLFAVKTILPQFATDLRFQQMFLDEARIASNIDHSNVAHIIDLGEEGDILYLVMEWIDGDSLSKLNRAAQKRGKKIPPGIVLRLLADISAGLHAAHEMRNKEGKSVGVVHRDVSPQNILVTTKGIAKLIDFGVAKARDRVAGDTSAGQLKGKIHYMAPEQALGKSVDRRADVWSVGAVAYHLLAGVPPFDGSNELATLHMLTSGKTPPPLPEYVPIAVADPIFRALVDDPEQRIATALDMQRALEQAMMDAGVQTSTADVAEYVVDHLGDRIEARRKAVDQAILAASERGHIERPRVRPRTEAGSGSGVDHMVSRVKPAPTAQLMPTPTSPGIGPHGTPEMFDTLPPDAIEEAGQSQSFSEPGSAERSAVSGPGSRAAGATSQPRPVNAPEFVVDFESPGSVASSATLGSAASEIQWPPPGTQAGWRRWAAWGAAGGLVIFALLLVGVLALRPSAPDPNTAAGSAPVTDPPTGAGADLRPTTALPTPTPINVPPPPTSAPPRASSPTVVGTLPPPQPPHPAVVHPSTQPGPKPPIPRPQPTATSSKKGDYGF